MSQLTIQEIYRNIITVIKLKLVQDGSGLGCEERHERPRRLLVEAKWSQLDQMYKHPWSVGMPLIKKDRDIAALFCMAENVQITRKASGT